LITSSKYLTFNILREYWVACCVFFYRSFDFRTYFLKNPVHSFFSGRFSFFCRNRLTLVPFTSEIVGPIHAADSWHIHEKSQ
jgi:hypothetical protein